MRKTAAGLAAVHQCGAIYGAHFEIDEWFAEAREKAQRLAAIVPGFEGYLVPVIAQLENLAATYPEDTIVLRMARSIPSKY